MKQSLSTTFAIDYDDAGEGPVVVLLHAFPLSRAAWRPQLEGLARDCRLITPDLRGFGGTSGFEAPPAIEQMADDVAGLLDVLRIDRAVVGGLSMGGYVALAFARKHASRLRGLILADTRADADSAEAKANRDRLIAFAETHPPVAVLDSLLPKLLCDSTRNQRPEIAAELRTIVARQTPPGIIGALKAMRDRPDATAVLDAIRVPALIVTGGEDALMPPAVAEAMAARLADARTALIGGAGHLSNLEQPETFNAAVRTYLNSLK